MAKSNFLLLAVLAAAAALAACSGMPEIQVPTEIKVQVPVACVRPEQRPEKPAVRLESDLMAMDRYRRTLAAWSDLKKLEIYSARLEALVEGCSSLPPAR